MPLVIAYTRRAADLLAEARAIATQVAATDIATIDLDEFMRLVERHYAIRLEVEKIARNDLKSLT